ncbi:alpha/beta hydrolase [Staphylococcus sp. NRL 16/872]|uniref:alpha/beta hydrolase n=1 Tax=Staphylococcus sp. NRL 16/872 TaxID=2930131 RepID=UPI001FB53FD1|nr:MULTISPECIES: alpha/beta hydrolase [unclassified Staphylococcus]MCJ1655508.1 alpha/beta hydrolase [Staphylococcus sp. NRL 21/187]MCJ1661340.1 alpha/beta hydrolase [Staphylococcus sp. NRL 18/288]MCJ1667230.1 alpha/beta hydrolase [Staphylococcus sp. NRL 19/737]WEN69714.1 alpha/beta hydrolase [Staphylococcus sp. NRL 16/872]
METLELKGAKLRYHKVGNGPVLICIPGANGTGDIYMPLAQQLKDKFTVVAVDRRGYGQSELTEPLPDEVSNPDSRYRVKRDAQDIAELANHLSDEPVYVLGSSSGAIVAMHVLKEHSDIVKRIAFHEPPINTFLPNAKYWQDKNAEIIDIAVNEGMPQAMKLFGETLNTSQLDRQYMSKPAQAEDDAESKKRFEEMLGWFKYEIRQYTESDISIDDLNKHKDIITLLNGTASRDSFPQEVNFYISEQTGIKIIDIPGGHLGYVQEPEGFANVVLEMWG